SDALPVVVRLTEIFRQAAESQIIVNAHRINQSSRIPASCAREETPESRGMPCLFLNTERGFGGKPPQKSGFRRHLGGSKMPKETFCTAISRWRVVSRRALDASGFWQG